MVDEIFDKFEEKIEFIEEVFCLLIFFFKILEIFENLIVKYNKFGL